jgi:phosphatidylglycerol:prolipoprotein diacylglycerol transferase
VIPYVHVPSVSLGPLTLHPFGVLVALAVLVGTHLAARRARRLGLDVEAFRSFVGWMLVAGFVGGHVIDAILYRPAQIVGDPLRLLYLWEGQGSFGGFLGALLGVLGWRHLEVGPARSARLGVLPAIAVREQPRAILPFADVVLAVFPVAWTLGRLGCAIAHDHPGVRAGSGSWLAVAYGAYGPGDVAHGPLGIELRLGDAPRYDLGTLEMLFALALAGAFALTWRLRVPAGFYVAATALAYAPARFALDFLRASDAPHADARYASLTPAQWSCVALFAFGLFFVARGPRGPRATSGASSRGLRDPPRRTARRACTRWRTEDRCGPALARCRARTPWRRT